MSTLSRASGPVTSLALWAVALSLAGLGCDATKTSSAAEDPPKDRANGGTPAAPPPAGAQQTGVTAQQPNTPGRKPNILFIMGDDIGWMQPSIYHRGLMVGETPNIDRIGNEGAMYVDYVAMQSCTSGRNAFFTGMYPGAHRHDPAAAARQPLVAAARHSGARQVPSRSRLHDGRVRQEPPRRPHRVATDRARLPGVLGLPLPPGRDAAGELPGHQQEPDRAEHRPALQEHPGPGPARRRGRRGPEDHDLPDAAAPGHLVQVLGRHDEEPALPRRGAPDPRAVGDRRRGDLEQGHRFSRSQRSRARPASRSSSGTTRRACTSRPCCRPSTRRWWASPAARTGASTKPA